MGYGWIVFFAILLAAAGGGVLYVRRKIREFSRAAFGSESLLRGLEMQADELAAVPKSVNSMTRVFLPQIERDFPQFNLQEFRQKAENMLLSAFSAIERQDAARLVNASGALRDQVRLEIDALRRRGAKAVYRRVRVHRTEIAGYRKADGSCLVTLQSALEYLHYTQEADGTILGDAERLTQTKYNTELLYIQDAAKISGKTGDKAVGLTCPNCGAPVTSLGEKSCEYCGAAVAELNIYAWVLNRFEEVNERASYPSSKRF